MLTTRPRRPPADGVLWLDRDLDPLLALTSEGVLPLATGGELRRGASRAECWTGPVGWLAGAQGAPLTGLRWDGRAVTAEPVVDAVAADSPEAQAVRRVLARHAGIRHRRSLPYDTWPPLTAVVLSALVEDRELLRRPLPPLSELLPLPEELRPQDCWGEAAPYESATTLRLALPTRVHHELARRADLLGERLPDYAALLLGAAADRVVPPAPAPYRYRAYDDASYADADVIELSRWSR